jgi:formylglycine-generating enzyme
VRILVLLAAFTCCVSAAAGETVMIGGGGFLSVLPTGGTDPTTRVAPFNLDRVPVTNGEFLDFVTHHREWRRDRIPALLADRDYLSHWQGAERLGPDAQPQQPVTRVSWFAARAYCEAAGGRLPTWAEWELVAAADETRPDARQDPEWRERILTWYGQPAGHSLGRIGGGQANFYGVQDLHGLVWEWVDDFNALLVSSDSRDQSDPDKLKFCGAGAISLADRDNYAVLMRVAFLSSLNAKSTARSLGFRCADSIRSKPDRPAAVQAPVPSPLPGESLYQLPITIVTDKGASMQLSALRGSPLIVTMFYSQCTSVCPLLTMQVQRIAQHLSRTERRRIRVLLVSFDSSRDSPATLRAFATEHHISADNWIIARASANDVHLLAAALGIQYRELPNHTFNHSTIISVTDRDGVVRAQTSDLTDKNGEFVAAVRSQLAPRPQTAAR